MRPDSVEEIATQTAARALEVLGIPMPALKRWPARETQPLEAGDGPPALDHDHES
jgi:hypothetical protein